MEHLDVVDENDNVIGRATREECHSSPKLIHRAVHVFVFNSKKELFVQKRGKHVDMYPEYFCSSAAGHVDAGESYEQAAPRELAEELGIKADMLVPLFKMKLTDGKQVEFNKLFFCFHKGEVKPDMDETCGGEFMGVEEIKRRMKTGEKFTPFFTKIFEKYCREFWFG